MFKISQIYFNFENIIIIDLKSNLGDGGQSFYVTIVSSIYMKDNENEFMRKHCDFSLKYNQDELSNNLNCYNCDQLLYKFIDCLTENDIKSKNLFINESLKLTDYSTDYSVIISGNEYQSSGYIPNKTSAYYYYIDDTIEKSEYHLNILDTIEINQNINLKKDNSFFKIHIKIAWNNFGVDIVINSYNTLKSYRINWKPYDIDITGKKILIMKTMHQYLKAPYGNCSDYQDRLFNSTNQWQCYRQCIKTFAEKKFDCKPVFIENTLHELDSDYYLDCNSSVQKKFDEYYKTGDLSSICSQICPKNCLNIDYALKVIRNTQVYRDYSYNYLEQTLYWDTTQPMFIYKEVPVLSFIEYMVYLGGLVGLWFGTSAKDVVIILFDKTFWLNNTLKLFVILIVLFKNLKIVFKSIIWYSRIASKFVKLYYILCLMKALCFVSLIYTSVLVTLDFFEYPYIFKLNVNNNINGFDLPPISFCTETNVLFDKNKIIEKYNESQEFQEFRANDLKWTDIDYRDRYEKCFDVLKRSDNLIFTKFEANKYYLKTNIDKNNKFIDDLRFEEKRNLMIRANHMINCSAKLHSRYDSNLFQTENCVQDLQVLESIYGNKDFGICFTFFSSKERFYLKENNYIEFKLSYENGPDFFVNPYFGTALSQVLNKYSCQRIFDKNTIIYVIIHQKSKHFVANKQNSIKLSRQGLEGELKFVKTSINLLSTPYMQLIPW